MINGDVEIKIKSKMKTNKRLLLSFPHINPNNAPDIIPNMCAEYATSEGAKIFDKLTRRYMAPATTNGSGSAVGKITNLPGHTNVPKPTKPDMAADAPMAIVS